MAKDDDITVKVGSFVLRSTRSTIEQCGPEVRWCAGRLQQLWEIRILGNLGQLESLTTEWRDVPSVDDP